MHDYDPVETEEVTHVKFTFEFAIHEELLRDAADGPLLEVLMDDLRVMVEDSLNDWREQNGVA